MTDARQLSDHGRIVSHATILGGAPVFAGTRIPVRAVRSFLAAGHRVEKVLAEYPSLVAADVEAARGPWAETFPCIVTSGQRYWHQDAYIVATPDGARALIASLQRALERGYDCLRPFADDGEGYHLHVAVAPCQHETEGAPEWPYHYWDASFSGGAHQDEFPGALKAAEKKP